MLAAAVRVDRQVEVDVRRIVGREDGLDVLLDHRGAGRELLGLRRLLEACIAAPRPRRWEDGCTDALMKMIPANYPGVIQLAYSKIKWLFPPVVTGTVIFSIGVSISRSCNGKSRVIS